MRTLITALSLMLLASPADAKRGKDLRQYVLTAVENLASAYPDKGYSAGAYYTHDLDYGPAGPIKAGPKHPSSMCVAAVAEVLITALALYAEAEHDATVFEIIPPRSWTRTSRDDIRPYIFMFDTVESHGTADALEQFGIGGHVTFGELLPGDFINLNRERTGHAVVFLGFLNADGEIEKLYDEDKVVGFKYFSSQGKNPGGFGYRWAYFDGHCPTRRDPAKPRDCGVRRSPRQTLLNTGYLLHPDEWRVKEARDERLNQRLKLQIEHDLGRSRSPTAFDRLSEPRQSSIRRRAEQELARDAGGKPPVEYDGATTDD